MQNPSLGQKKQSEFCQKSKMLLVERVKRLQVEQADGNGSMLQERKNSCCSWPHATEIQTAMKIEVSQTPWLLPSPY